MNIVSTKQPPMADGVPVSLPVATKGTPSLGNGQITFRVNTAVRNYRYSLRDKLRGITTIERVGKCGHFTTSGAVSIRHGENAFFTGLQTCSNVWVCPVCSPKIAAGRKFEVETAVDKAISENLYVSMVTLTVRHHAGHSLGEVWSANTQGWSYVVNGQNWLDFKEKLGITGYVKATEVTHGKNGWHVHLHVLMLSKNDPETFRIEIQRKQGRAKNPYPIKVVSPLEFVTSRWNKKINQLGFDTLDGVGVTWQTASDPKVIGQYVCKISTSDKMSSETTLGHFKEGRNGNRTPFQILGDLMAKETTRDLDLWKEYESVARGKRAVIFSTGLKKWAGLGEKTDDELAADFEDTEVRESELVAVLPVGQWRKLHRVCRPVFLLELCEKHGHDSVRNYLRENGIDFFLPSYKTDLPPN